MNKFLRPMLLLNLCYAVLVFGYSAATLWRIGLEPATATFFAIGVVALGVTIFGFVKEQPFTVAGGCLATAILLPTPLGLPVIIAGFVLFVLLVSLEAVIRLEGR